MKSGFDVDQFIEQIVTGLSIGSILLLVALGLSIIYGSMGIINLAHGEFVMLGAYAAWVFHTYLGLGLLASLGRQALQRTQGQMVDQP